MLFVFDSCCHMYTTTRSYVSSASTSCLLQRALLSETACQCTHRRTHFRASPAFSSHAFKAGHVKVGVSSSRIMACLDL